MVLSMTGYGRAGALLHGRDIKVELRSVNARFFEYSSRLPRSCAFLEDKLARNVRLFFTHDTQCALAQVTRDEKGRFGTTHEVAELHARSIAA